jgi:SAM-dependent methyltransferase
MASDCVCLYLPGRDAGCAGWWGSRRGLNCARWRQGGGHDGEVAGDFGGEVAAFYARYRRGYPPAFVGALARALGLGGADVAADVGCGTGQLTVPLAGHVRAMVGIDPEPAMLALAAEAAAGQQAANITWVLGDDSELAALAGLLGERTLAAITIANAIHLMPCQQVFAAARRLLRPGGGLAVIANGTPLWQQPSHWSQALRAALEGWLDTRLDSCCGTDPASRQRYRAELGKAGFTGFCEETADYVGHLTVEQVIGHLYSAMPRRLLPPPDRRAAFAGHIREAIGSGPQFTEPVHLAALIGRAPP